MFASWFSGFWFRILNHGLLWVFACLILLYFRMWVLLVLLFIVLWVSILYLSVFVFFFYLLVTRRLNLRILITEMLFIGYCLFVVCLNSIPKTQPFFCLNKRECLCFLCLDSLGSIRFKESVSIPKRSLLCEMSKLQYLFRELRNALFHYSSIWESPSIESNLYKRFIFSIVFFYY